MPILKYLFYHNFLINNHTKKIINNNIDMNKFNVIYNEYKDTSPDPGYSKYLNLNNSIKKTLLDVYRLRLHKAKPMSILDIGTGAGYFPFICQYFGHRVCAIDLDVVQMYNEMVKLLNVNRKTWEVKAYEKLPDFGQKFNLITAFAICFNNHKRQNLWTEKEWRFFLTDLANNHLTDEGRVLLVLNPENDGKYYDKELLHFFESTGSSVKNERVFYKSLSSFKQASV